MRPLLPDLIHTDQNGFVQNRYLGNNVLDVYSFMTLAEEAVEKAFDSIDWAFLCCAGIWFPPSFLHMINVMQTNANVQIFDNRHLSSDIELRRGLAQGCGASPYLFILAIKTLAHFIRSDPRIPGVNVTNSYYHSEQHMQQPSYHTGK